MAKANVRAKTSFLIIIPPSLRLIHQVLTVTLAKPRIRAGHFNEAIEIRNNFPPSATASPID
jgi:hypothetical protein